MKMGEHSIIENASQFCFENILAKEKNDEFPTSLFGTLFPYYLPPLSVLFPAIYL